MLEWSWTSVSNPTYVEQVPIVLNSDGSFEIPLRDRGTDLHYLQTETDGSLEQYTNRGILDALVNDVPRTSSIITIRHAMVAVVAEPVNQGESSSTEPSSESSTSSSTEPSSESSTSSSTEPSSETALVAARNQVVKVAPAVARNQVAARNQIVKVAPAVAQNQVVKAVQVVARNQVVSSMIRFRIK